MMKQVQIRERGASLVEVMVTMALMSILMSAFAASVETGATGSHMEDASRSLLGELQLARQRAITEGRECRVSFDRVNNTYVVWVDYNGNGAVDPPAAGQMPEIKAAGRLEGGVAFDFNAGISAPPSANTSGAVGAGSLADGLRFNGRGRCSDDTGVGVPKEVYITNGLGGADARMAAITVRAATGRARLWKLKKGTNNVWS